MAIDKWFSGIRQRVRSIYGHFFYEGGEAPAPQMQQGYPDP